MPGMMTRPGRQRFTVPSGDLRRGASADADDLVVLQQDPAFLVDLILFVLRDDLCAIQQCLYGRFLLYIRDMIVWYYLITDIKSK